MRKGCISVNRLPLCRSDPLSTKTVQNRFVSEDAPKIDQKQQFRGNDSEDLSNKQVKETVFSESMQPKDLERVDFYDRQKTITFL